MSIISAIVNIAKGGGLAAPPAPPPTPTAPPPPERERLSFESQKLSGEGAPGPLSAADKVELGTPTAKPVKTLRPGEQFGLLDVRGACEMRLRQANPASLAKIEAAMAKPVGDFKAAYARYADHDRHAVVREARALQEQNFATGFSGAAGQRENLSRQQLEAKHREALRGIRAMIKDSQARARAIIQPLIQELQAAALEDAKKLEEQERANAEKFGVEYRCSATLATLQQSSWRLPELFEGDFSPAQMLDLLLAKNKSHQ